MIHVKIKNTDRARKNSNSGFVLGFFPFKAVERGVTKHYYPLDEVGNPIPDVWHIEDSIQLDPSSDRDKKQLVYIKKFIQYHPDLKYNLLLDIYDPTEQVNKTILKGQRIYEVNGLLQSLKNDQDSLKVIYRRVIGNAGTRDNLTILSELLTKSTENPDLFYYDGQLITENPIYQLQIMVDKLIDGGFFKQDHVGNIYHNSIKIADGVNDCIMKMQSNDKLMKDAKEFLDNPDKLLPSPEVAEMDDIYKDLLADVDASIPEHLIPVEDLSFNTVTGEEDRDALFKFAEQYFDKLLAQQYIVKEGVGAGTKYSPYDNPTVKLNKVGLLNYFANNEGVIKQLVSLIERG